jgi:hypothetical protein
MLPVRGASDSSGGERHEPEFLGNPRFQVVRKLGLGATGAVYEAIDREQSVRVAIKVLRTFDAEVLIRFKKEFRALQELQHPNLVSLGELFQDGGRWFFTMEYIDGPDLLSYVRTDGAHDIEFTDPMHSEPRFVTTIDERPLETSDSADPLVVNVSLPIGYDEGRLRASFVQLARGLCAIHDANKVHRDVKPSNVLVSGAGHVIVLDFGLVLDVGGVDSGERDQVVGTIAYMAPEQAAAIAVGPEADWYAFGAVLYQALTGRLPISGTAIAVLAGKHRVAPRPPAEVVAGAPEDLSDLCMELLRVDAWRRPRGDEVVRRLGGGDSSSARTSLAPAAQATFVGRRAEMAALSRALDATREGRPVTVYVQGESGVGKSALVRQFATSAAAERGAIVLAGRCYERESVPFKALDGVLDAVAALLEGLPEDEARKLWPHDLPLLSRVFPVLRKLTVVDEMSVTSLVDPRQQRLRVFGAMRELLENLTRTAPVVVAIDDVQWTDGDSSALLRDLLQPGAGPPVLLVLTRHIPATASGPVSPQSAEPVVDGDVRYLQLQPLPDPEARELAERLLAQSGASATSAIEIAAGAHGHPFFIDELVRHVASGDASPSAAGRIDEALWSRIGRLEPATRAILDVVSVAGMPLRAEIVTHALGIDFGDLAKRSALLRAASLLRTTGARKTDWLEPYHDAVRRAVAVHLGEATQASLHARIAEAIEASGQPDAEALAMHWQAARQPERAARHVLVAARQADAALAFERAVQLYRVAIDHVAAGGGNTRELEEAHAEALANAGRGAEAAAAFDRATTGADPVRAIEMRRRSAEQLLVAGHYQQGLAALRAVVASVGMSLPEGRFGALVLLLLRRLRLRLRGLRFVERSAEQVPPDVLQRVDVCWAAARGLNRVDTILAAEVQSRHMLLALKAGEPFRVLRACAGEAIFLAAAGSRTRQRTENLLELAARVAMRCDNNDPRVEGLVLGMRAMSYFLEGRWRAGARHAEKTIAILRERCAGVVWEIDTFETDLAACQYFLGRLREMRRRVPGLIADARARGDHYALTHLQTGIITLAWLSGGEVDDAKRMLDDAATPVLGSRGPLAHLLEVQSGVQLDLYTGATARAHRRVLDAWPEIRQSRLVHVQYLRVTLLDLRARTALAAARAGDDTEQRLRDASRAARRLEREGAPWALALAQMTDAGVAAARRDLGTAAALLRAAADAFTSCDMEMHAAVAIRRLEDIAADGGSRRQAADAWFQRERVRDPAAFVRVLAPGFDRAK